jgi:nuclear pore complex protein Nup188
VYSSWKAAFYALCDSGDSENAKSTVIEQLFSDPKVLELLAHPLKAFPAPSQQTKNTFETRTSAINVTPSSNTRYDIKKVKEDALWLSNEAKIDEVTALRIVLEECQGRPSAQLLGRLSNEELASLQEAAGTSQASSALLLDSDTIEEDFDSQKNRRVRILSVYLSERRNLLQCLNIVCQKTLYPGPDAPRSGKGKAAEVPESWVETIGNNLIPTMGPQDPWIVEALSAIEINVDHLSTGSGWFKKEGGREDIETEWVNNQLMEISYMMEIIFQMIDVRTDLSSSTVILAWLKLVERFNFFDQFTAVSDP